MLNVNCACEHIFNNTSSPTSVNFGVLVSKLNSIVESLIKDDNDFSSPPDSVRSKLTSGELQAVHQSLLTRLHDRKLQCGASNDTLNAFNVHRQTVRQI